MSTTSAPVWAACAAASITSAFCCNVEVPPARVRSQISVSESYISVAGRPQHRLGAPEAGLGDARDLAAAPWMPSGRASTTAP